VRERSITGEQLTFSSLERNIPEFSLMLVLLTLIFSVSLALREEEVWNTSARLSIAPVSPAGGPRPSAGFTPTRKSDFTIFHSYLFEPQPGGFHLFQGFQHAAAWHETCS
jgi:hypothetical protein